MNAVVFEGHGDPSTLCKKEVPYPHGFDADSNILIRVMAASINPVDKMLINGGLKMLRPVATFPHTPCYDVCGTVEVADAAGTFQTGDAVMVRLFGDKDEDGPATPWYRGAMAEYCVARTAHCVPQPAALTCEQAASVPLAGMTALQALTAAGVREGGSVFISGGAGGVGTLAIQLAKHHFKAARVVTTASVGEKEELVRSLGADEVVYYKTDNFEKVFANEKFDACLDTTDESLKMAQIIKEGGKIVTIAGTPTLEEIRAVGGSAWILKLFLAKTKKRPEFKAAVAAGADWRYLFLHPSQADLATLAGHLEDGTVKTVVDNVWSFTDEDAETGWRAAFTRQFSGRSKGKCVVRMQAEEAKK